MPKQPIDDPAVPEEQVRGAVNEDADDDLADDDDDEFDDGDDDVGRGRADVPGVDGMDVGAGDAAVLAGVAERPLFAGGEARVVGHGA